MRWLISALAVYAVVVTGVLIHEWRIHLRTLGIQPVLAYSLETGAKQWSQLAPDGYVTILTSVCWAQDKTGRAYHWQARKDNGDLAWWICYDSDIPSAPDKAGR